MKHRNTCIAFASVLLIAQTASAAPRAAECTGVQYLVAAEDLSSWHLGAYFRQQERNANVRGVDQDLTMQKVIFSAAYEVLPWVSVFGTVGQVTPDSDTPSVSEDGAAELGVGMWVNLIDHDLIDQITEEMRLRVQGIFHYMHGEPELGSADLTYNEVYGSVTLSFVNEIVGNKKYWPESVSLFVGPVYSYIEGEDFDVDAEEVGFVAGSDVIVGRRLSFSVMYEMFDGSNNALTAGMNVRF